MRIEYKEALRFDDAGRMSFRKVFFGLSVIAVAFFYRRYHVNHELNLDKIEQSVLNAWNVTISQPVKSFQRVAVGINCNLDLIVSGVELLEGFKLGPGANLDSVQVSTLKELQETFTHYFTKGAAAERVFTHAETYNSIIEKAGSLKNKQYYIGGNAALMAAKVAEMFDGIAVQLVGPIGPLLKEMIPGTIHIPGTSIIQHDEVHLIMEYGVNEKWGHVTAPVASRFITSYDESNSRLTMLNTFFSSLSQFSPDLVLLSGLHMLDGERNDIIMEKLDAVKQGLQEIDPRIPVHLELASMANDYCVRQILDKVISEVTSLGLNEEELSFLSYVADGPHGSNFRHHSGQPQIDKVGDMIYWLLKTYGYSGKKTNSKLTRVHFHSLTYHIAGVVPSHWDNVRSSVAAGTHMASRQACDVSVVTPKHVEIRTPEKFRLFSGDIDRTFEPNSPVIEWELGGFQFVFSPVLVCSQPQKTVGLGDAISSTGLMYSQYNPS